MLREDGLSKLDLRSTAQCRKISNIPMAPTYLRDVCPKLSWESMNLGKMCVMTLFPSRPTSKALDQNCESLVIIGTTVNSG